MNTLTQIIENTFNPSAKDMRLLTEAIQANKELAGLFNSAQSKVIVEKSSTAAPKKPRAPSQKKDDAVRCTALVWNLEVDETTGELVAKRCTRGCEGESKFCKQHGLADGKKCAECSAYCGKDIVHDFKHEHLGTTENPSWAFEKYHQQLLAIYNNSLKKLSASNEAPVVENEVSAPAKKKVGRPSKKTETVAADKPKREANGFIKFLNSKRDEIKAQILAEQPELKGKFLTGAISKRAGELWKTVKGTEAVEETQSADDTLSQPDEIQEKTTLVEEQTQPEEQADEEEQEDDEVKLEYNSQLNVWVDVNTDLYYKTEDSPSADGAVVNGVLKPFKIRK